MLIVSTGANKGIGSEVAHQLAASGCKVLVGARNKARGDEAAAKLKKRRRRGRPSRDRSRGFRHDCKCGTVYQYRFRPSLDILLSNAGIVGLADGLLSGSSLDAIERASAQAS